MNILIVFSDQQHKFALGKMNPDYITPHLDALVADGVLFRNAYSPNPVCGPYRGCLMTGQLPSHCRVLENGSPLLDSSYTLAEAMKSAGYGTGYVGKYHLGGTGNIPIDRMQRRGFDRFMGYQCYNGFRPDPPYNNDVRFFDEEDRPHVYDCHRTDATTDIALEVLKELDCARTGKPFFMMVSYQAPHYPEQPSDECARLYDGKLFALTPDYRPVDPYTPTYSPYSPRPFELCPDYRNYGNDMQRYLQLYAGLCTQVDAGVGRIIAQLKADGLYDDTLIVYTSDHGDMQGSRGLKNKCYPYEMSAGVPMIVRYPGSAVRGPSDILVTALDLFPTCCELGGKEPPIGLDGESLLPYLAGRERRVHDYVISEYSIETLHWRMIRGARYKLITTLDYWPMEMYDMLEDPWETSNLVGRRELSAIADDMLDALESRTAEILPSSLAAEPADS